MARIIVSALSNVCLVGLMVITLSRSNGAAWGWTVVGLAVLADCASFIAGFLIGRDGEP